MFESGNDITHETAKTVLTAGLQHISQGATRCDCAALTHFDSSALAVFLAWRRAAQQRAQTLLIVNVPEKLSSLARAYGIDALAVPAVPAVPAGR